MMDQLRFGTANIGGRYDSSRQAEQAVTSARHNMAQFLNCDMEEMLGLVVVSILSYYYLYYLLSLLSCKSDKSGFNYFSLSLFGEMIKFD